MDVLSPTWIQDLIQAYGLWVLFTLVMLESMGIPMPGETALVTAALYAGSTHQIGIASVVLVAATAAMIGDNIGYLIGRSIGVRLVVRYGRYVRLSEPRLKVGQYRDRQRAGKIGSTIHQSIYCIKPTGAAMLNTNGAERLLRLISFQP